MSAVTTHVLDIAHGVPARGVGVEIEEKRGSGWVLLGSGKTDSDGRLRDLLADNSPLHEGVYRLRFFTGDYFSRLGIAALHPLVEIVFNAKNEGEHCHIPLLVSPHAYSTYRGS